MKKSTSIGVFSLLISSLFVGIAVPGAAQNISGTVIDAVKTGPIQGIQVSFLDAGNADLVDTTLTIFDGSYDSGPIPTGVYRVRFSDPSGAHTPGFFVPEFFGAGGVDDFCLATVATVLSGSTTSVDEAMAFSGPVAIVTRSGAIAGTVLDADAATEAPLQGIQVSLLEGGNAELIATITTDASGGYIIDPFSIRVDPTFRVRFSDPTATFFPQFFSAGGLDDFCSGTALSLDPPSKLGASAFMVRIPPEQNTQNLIDIVNSLPIPNDVSTVLATPLIRAVDLLTDDNPNNDAAVCGQLTSFITRVNIREKKGQLSPTEANDLRQNAEATQLALGCS